MFVCTVRREGSLCQPLPQYAARRRRYARRWYAYTSRGRHAHSCWRYAHVIKWWYAHFSWRQHVNVSTYADVSRRRYAHAHVNGHAHGYVDVHASYDTRQANVDYNYWDNNELCADDRVTVVTVLLSECVNGWCVMYSVCDMYCLLCVCVYIM